MTNEDFVASRISNCADVLSDVRSVADAGILSKPTTTTRSSHVFVAYLAVSSMNLRSKKLTLT